ncbi:MAG: NTP transferase domain-containing protein [Candidatus Cloacimonetes bacterium]|nr:NTP transferase domain-containing protein [Candidatus Cloacimonadota bacterium]
MKAFILAAGEGKRLENFTEYVPKPLLPILGRPIICYSLARLRQAGINQLLINTYHLGDKIRDFFEYHNNFGFEITFSAEEHLLGTGGALKKCADLLTEPFLLLNADIITDMNFFELVKRWDSISENSVLTLSGKSMEKNYSVAVCDGRIVDFSGLAASGKADNFQYIGQAILHPEILEYLPDGVSALTSNGFMGLLKNDSLGYYEHKSWWFDIGTRKRMKEAEKFLKAETGMTVLLNQEQVEPRLSFLYKLYKDIVEL